MSLHQRTKNAIQHVKDNYFLTSFQSSMITVVFGHKVKIKHSYVFKDEDLITEIFPNRFLQILPVRIINH